MLPARHDDDDDDDIICCWIPECSLNIYGTHVTANDSTNNNVVFFFVLDFKIEYYYNC